MHNNTTTTTATTTTTTTTSTTTYDMLSMRGAVDLYPCIYLSIYISIYLPIYLSIYRSICLSIYLSLSLQEQSISDLPLDISPAALRSYAGRGLYIQLLLSRLLSSSYQYIIYIYIHTYTHTYTHKEAQGLMLEALISLPLLQAQVGIDSSVSCLFICIIMFFSSYVLQFFSSLFRTFRVKEHVFG